ncbi:MAG: hypothetical protein GEEBNDBF_01192 [bacterium]|nr:hypothetical protein [bacterium]
MSTGPADPFREERHFSRLAAVYALLIVLLVAVGLGLYWWDFRHRPPLETDSTRMRDAVRAMLEEN